MIIGLTGSIGMGKSTTARMFREEGVPVHDADEAVHLLYAGKALPLVAEAFPQAIVNGAIDRKALGALALQSPAALQKLEALIHPLVREEERAFLARHPAPLVLLDIPLLFETGADQRCDAVIVVTASPETQKARVLARPGMSLERFESILKRQMPDREKRLKAHFIINTELGLESARRQVRDVVQALRGR